MGVNYISTMKRWRIYRLPLSSLSVIVQFFSPLVCCKGSSAGRLHHHNGFQGLGAAGSSARVCADEQQHARGSGLHAAVAVPPSRLHWDGHGEAPQRTGWALLEPRCSGSSTCSQCALTIRASNCHLFVSIWLFCCDFESLCRFGAFSCAVCYQKVRSGGICSLGLPHPHPPLHQHQNETERRMQERSF